MTNRLKEKLKNLEEEWYEGKLTHHDHFDAIEVIDDALNQVPAEIAVEDRRRFMASCFRHFMTMHRRMKFFGDVIHQLLLWEFRLAEDLDAFDAFSWGVLVYSHSIFSFKHALDERREGFESHQQANGADVHMMETYNIYGLSYALLMFARMKLVPTKVEKGEPYYTGIDKAISDPLSAGQETISYAVSARPSDTEGSDPEHRREGEQMHSDPELAYRSHQRQIQVRFMMHAHTAVDTGSRGDVGGKCEGHMECRIKQLELRYMVYGMISREVR
ncbi:hypothetical protein Ddye_025477 [Dipteronia dyeriana]|uniref:Uncharacterized protein n=1 Tax=Dipteronia dyeriana TaxID=168575 RepID=A0AAD9WPG4_9ROSI|nr:hypothetical protein Ddye_025477 [Dipteronia dyeriana]